MLQGVTGHHVLQADLAFALQFETDVAPELCFVDHSLGVQGCRVDFDFVRFLEKARKNWLYRRLIERALQRQFNVSSRFI